MQEHNPESGMATLEALPLMIVFMVLLAYMFGMYGVTHTAILNSIGARNYAFETFRNRADLKYFRSNDGAMIMSFDKIGTRVHSIISEVTEDTGNGQFPATVRKIAMGLDASQEEFDKPQKSIHNLNSSRNVYSIADGARNSNVGVRDVWVMTQYGICLTARCGDK